MKKWRLKEKIHELERDLTRAELDKKGMQREIDDLNNRLRIAGIKRGFIEDVPGIETSVKTYMDTWGMYATVDDDLNAIEIAKNKLVENIAKALVEKNIVQFIVKAGPDKDYPLQPSTVGAKLYCIPWEKAALKEGEPHG